MRAEQRRRWRAGDRVPLEALLADRPHLAADRSLLIDLVYSEFVLAREVGAPASPTAYADRFPAVAAELAEQLELECALMPGAGTTLTGTGSAGPPAAGPFPRLPGFEIEGELGRGGMGVVYQARQVRLNRVVAVKTLPDRRDPDAADAVRFLAEAELVAAVKHPHVVAVFEFGQADGRPYFAMEYLPGGSLRDRLKAGGALDPRAAAVLMAKVARGVQAAHDQQVVHRDLKPANVLFDEAGEPKVTDFGLARRGAGAGLTATQVVLGTPAYMAPEQAEGRGKFVGPAADVWALGAVLYESLTGSVPFPGDDPMTVLRQVMQDDPASLRTRNPAVPRDLDLVCLKCLRKDPRDRYPTAAALADDLDRFAAGRPVSVRAAGPAERAARWARRNPRDAALVGTVAFLLLALAGGGTAAAVWMGQEREIAKANEERARTLGGIAKGRAEELEVAGETLRQQLIQSNRAIPGEVRAMRLRGDPGQYFKGLPRLREALDLARKLGAPPEDVHEIRNEMLNLLTVTDVHVEAEWDGWPAGRGTIGFSPDLDRYLQVTPGEAPTLRAAPGGHVLGRLPRDVGSPAWIKFAPGGRRLLLGYGRQIDVWELGDATGRHVRRMDGTAGDFVGGGDRVAIGGVFDGRPEVRVVSTATGAVERRVPDAAWVPLSLPVHRSRPWVAVERGGRLVVWDHETGTEVAARNRPAGDYRVSWHPTRPVLAVAAEREIRQWDVRTGRDVTPPLRGHTHDGVYAGFDRTGTVVVSADWSSVLRCWDADTGRQLTTGPLITLSADFAAAPPGRLAAAVKGGRFQLYGFHAGRGLRIATRQDSAKDGFTGLLFVSPDGRLLAARVGDARCVLLDPATGTELAVLPGAFRPVGFQSDGALLTLGPYGPTRWPVRHAGGRCRVGPPVRLIPTNMLNNWGSSTDGGVLAEPGIAGARTQFHHLPSGRRVLTDPQRDPRWAHVSPCGEWAVVPSHDAGENASVTVYDTGTGAVVAQLADTGGRAWFAPDGESVAVAGLYGGVRVFETGAWTQRWHESGHTCAFDPTGRLLAVGDGQGVIRLREVNDGHEVARLEVPDQTRLVPECFGPDGGRLFATGLDNRQLYVWDLRHLRAGLAVEKLDWDWPALPAAEDGPAPDRVDVVPLGLAERLMEDTNSAIRDGDPKALADRIGRLRELDPDNPLIAARLAHLLLTGPSGSFDPKAAAAFARRAVERLPDPEDTTAGRRKAAAYAHVVLGLAHYHLGDFRAAAAAIDRGLRADAGAGFVYAWYTLARARLLAGDPAGAAKAARDTIKVWVRQAWGAVEASGRPPKEN